MASKTDSQRQRVYKAEQAMYRLHPSFFSDPGFMDPSLSQAAISSLPSSDRIERAERRERRDGLLKVARDQAMFESARLAMLLAEPDWWREHFPHRVAVVPAAWTARASRGGWYDTWGWTIRLTTHGMQPGVVVHEMAHVATESLSWRGRSRGDHDAYEAKRAHPLHDPGHGPLYCAVFLAVTRVALGTRAEAALRDGFEGGGVRVRAKSLGCLDDVPDTGEWGLFGLPPRWYRDLTADPPAASAFRRAAEPDPRPPLRDVLQTFIEPTTVGQGRLFWGETPCPESSSGTTGNSRTGMQ